MWERTERLMARPAGDPDAEQLWHVIITRFSYRNRTRDVAARRRAVDDWERMIDPLDPERLEFRTRLFELTCAPSLVAQRNQQFDWIIVIDECLPQSYRSRILDAVRNRPRTHLHQFSPNEDLTRSEWLVPYVPAKATLLLTTLLDDDDALPYDFVSAMQAYVVGTNTRLPPLMTLGARSCLQWEAVWSSRAPLGYVCTWHRGNAVCSAGFSLLCQYPEVALTVFSIDHVVGDIWYAGEGCRGVLEKGLSLFHTQAGHLIEASREWSALYNVELFVDVSSAVGPVVMTNHFFNDQAWRLLEYKPDRRRVHGGGSFPKFALNLWLFTENSAAFSKRWHFLARLLRQAVSVPQGQRAVPRYRQILLAAWVFWRFLIL